MRVALKTLLCVATVGVLALTAFDGASAQKYRSRGTPSIGASEPTAPSRGDGGHRGGGHWRGPGWEAAVPAIIGVLPHLVQPSHSGEFIDDGTVVEEVDRPHRRSRRPPTRRTVRRTPSNAPPAGERRLVPDEIVIELRNTMTQQQVQALQSRHRLTRLESQVSQLSGTTMYRWRIPDRRSVPTVVRELERDNVVASAQPNYLFTLQDSDTPSEGDPAQYELTKLHLPQAHKLAHGSQVLVAVIDSGIDAQHPDLAGAVVDSFDTLASDKTPFTPHKHGTAIAGLIAARGKLVGAAPEAQILAIRAFDPDGHRDATTFNILKGLDWAATHHARVINMSFAGPSDPAIHRSLASRAQARHRAGRGRR